MQVFYHLIYEYQKGLRDLCLFTCTIDLLQKVEKSLNLQGIEHLILRVGKDKMNAFFGTQACLKIVKQFSAQNLSLLTPEEDFILGMMLGLIIVGIVLGILCAIIWSIVKFNHHIIQ